MPYTPVELRHVKIARALFGYKRAEAERLLEDVANSFEDVWRDRGELTDKVEELEKELAEHKQREHLLTQTLVAAERSAADARDAARREAELIIAEAHQEARSVMHGAQSERERIVLETRRIQTLLRAALGLVDEGSVGQVEGWPSGDTREFQAIKPELKSAPEQVDDEEPAPSRDFQWG
jgi:cell division initiation protein